MLPLAARRVFRLSLTVSLSLIVGYASASPLPFIAPILAFFLAATPGPPIAWRGLAGLLVLVVLTTGSGVLLIPLLIYYPASALLLVAVGVYAANYLSVNLRKGPVAALLAMGLTMISAAGTQSSALAVSVIEALLLGIGIAVACHWLVYLLFPDGTGKSAVASETPPIEPSNWIALRATLIVMPAYLLVLVNPAMYMPVMMKSVSLGQQSSLLHARDAGRELLGSTFIAGLLAIAVWAGLGIATNLWMYFLWMLLVTMLIAAKLYGVMRSRHPASYWVNTGVTLLILLGPAVEDSANGKDVYAAFFTRMALFVGVTIYAWGAIVFLEHLRERSQRRRAVVVTEAG